ncbi:MULTISPECIES: hypothetical protein [Vibrio]|uniref:Uncharacterized protein n=2 Tax=Vibrio TaxID=662 RepID=A0A1E5CPK4_9VIBR|nr:MULTISPECIES: hypothetical protein [Vibrio]RBW64413.1 hypothetical protein DS893_14775 [Vibrionales bacterium C3R12]MDN3699299.1 hypothetical protein [Vibrio cortegadensis]NOH83678.1 hypothetical protein [Vibrio sp. 03-59-1]OEE71844.1 hypothetical protein A130_07635 [Vibrio genomosp. F6 str. FF-238]TKF21249.1 hypothetical protein FCV43_12700 [Vibrio genomosp. F6]
MAHAMNIETIATPISMDKKTYSVNFKGLIAHIVDIMFGKEQVESTYYASNLSGHMQKDIGIYR